jgi:hypothetical protein
MRINKTNNVVAHGDRKAFWMLILLLFCGGVREASAALISLGARIPLTGTTFALPIEISDALELTEWSFNLTYDPSDVLINTACDPFSGDAFCSLLTGPVTEGNFFSGGAPFNVLVPGLIELDAVTLAQTGLLFGVHGAFGGIPPGPSGSGTLAFIQFTLLGDGDSPIDVGDGGGGTPVPEPGALVLLAMGLLMFAMVKQKREDRVMRFKLFNAAPWVVLGALALPGEPSVAQAAPPTVQQPTMIQQPPEGYPPTTAPSAAGSYLAAPAWTQKFASNVRFIILTTFTSDAILDRETGLVWARQPTSGLQSTPDVDWLSAAMGCGTLVAGGRAGWRLPTAAELQSLIDHSIPEAPNVLKLPAGHPFLLHPAATVAEYWTGQIFQFVGTSAFTVNLTNGRMARRFPELTTERHGALCVRGAQ